MMNKISRRSTFLSLLAVLGLSCPMGSALAQASNNAPFEMVVLFPAGSSADVGARILAEGMSKYLEQPVPVINKPGGGGAIGYKYVAAARPDGRTMVWNSNSISTTFHGGTMNIDYKAFEAVARATIEIPAVVVQASSPWKTMGELIDYARANPGKLKVGNSGTGSHTHMASTALFETVGAHSLDVPFNSSQVVTNLLGGHVDAIIQLPSAVAPHVRSGSLRVLGVLGSRRDPIFPDAPTAAELGLTVPAMDLWRGIGVPRGTPPATLARLEKAIQFALQRPEFISTGQKLGFVPAFLPSRDFAQLIAREDDLIARQMEQFGMKKKQ